MSRWLYFRFIAGVVSGGTSGFFLLKQILDNIQIPEILGASLLAYLSFTLLKPQS